MPVKRALVHHDAGGFDESPCLDDISELIEAKDQIVWIDIQDPDDADIELLRKEFGFHELALEDVDREHQRPKIERYDGYYFLVFYALRRQKCPGLDLFIGERYLVTIHHGETPEIETTVERWRQNADRLGHAVAVPIYSLLDSIVDSYFLVVDEIAEEVEDVESAMFRPGAQSHQAEIFRLKRELLNLRRILAPEREVLNTLIRRDEPVLGEETLPYFQDVYDHVMRVLDTVDLNRDQLSGLLDAHLSVVSNRLNMVMKRMTALATILMSVNLVASNYGMNFKIMPEEEWAFGYPFALALMVVIGLILTYIFRRIDWL